MFVTGGPPVLGGGGHPPTHQHHLFRVPDIADHRCRIVGKDTRHRRQVADIAVQASEETGDRCPVGCDRIQITHSAFAFGHELDRFISARGILVRCFHRALSHANYPV